MGYAFLIRHEGFLVSVPAIGMLGLLSLGLSLLRRDPKGRFQIYGRASR